MINNHLNLSFYPFRLRSLLFVPAIKEKFYHSIISMTDNHLPDGVIFDLEGAIGKNSKSEARITLKKLLSDQSYVSGLKNRTNFLIRPNRFNSPYFKEDIELIQELKPDAIMLAAVTDPKIIEATRKLSRSGCLIIMIEDIKSLQFPEKILGACQKGDLLTFGIEDISAELGIERPISLNSPSPLTNLLCSAIAHGRSHDIPSLGPVFRFINRPKEILSNECSLLRDWGCIGSLAIHPSQVSTINDIFSKEEVVLKASTLINKFDSINDGTMVIKTVDSEMLDTPSYDFYKKIIYDWNWSK